MLTIIVIFTRSHNPFGIDIELYLSIQKHSHTGRAIYFNVKEIDKEKGTFQGILRPYKLRYRSSLVYLE